MARRVELRLKFQNVKVPADINKYLSSITFTDEDEDNADDLQSLPSRERGLKYPGAGKSVPLP